MEHVPKCIQQTKCGRVMTIVKGLTEEKRNWIGFFFVTGGSTMWSQLRYNTVSSHTGVYRQVLQRKNSRSRTEENRFHLEPRFSQKVQTRNWYIWSHKRKISLRCVLRYISYWSTAFVKSFSSTIFIFTGRNEVLAKVIFLQACVCPQWGGGYPSMPCRSVRGGSLVPGGLQFFGGGSPIFWGGLQFFGIRSTFGRYASYWNAFLLNLSLRPL